MTRRPEPVFRPVGEGRYALEVADVGVTLDVDRLRRERNELICELAVYCRLPGAHTLTPDGLIHLADFNLSSAHSRGTRAKMLRERSEAELDWATWLEYLAVHTLRAERTGMPARAMVQYDATEEAGETWNILGLQLPRQHPALIFGDGASLKSYLALFVAGTLAAWDVPTLYVDWELDGPDQRRRLHTLFGEEPPQVYYLRCDRPLVDEADRIRREVGRLGIAYVVYDSVGFATAGPPEAAEMAMAYFRAVRQVGCLGSLHLAHSTKMTGIDPKQFHNLKPFGSVFWWNAARSIWYTRRAQEDTPAAAGSPIVGLYHQKANMGPLLPSVGLQFAFRRSGPAEPFITKVNLAEVMDLSLGLSVRERITSLLQGGPPKTIHQIADELEAPIDSVKKALTRGEGTLFVRVIKTDDGIHRWALLYKH